MRSKFAYFAAALLTTMTGVMSQAPEAFAAAVPTPKLHLRSGSFDPRGASGLAVPNASRVAQTATKAGLRGSFYYLVQFNGPILPEWKAAMRDVGAEPLSYMPDLALITRMTPHQERLVSAMPFVRWTGRMKPEWRIHPTVLASLSRTAQANLTIVAQPGESIDEIRDVIRKQFPQVAEIKAPNPNAQKMIVHVTSADVQPLVELVSTYESLAWIEPWIEPTVRNNESIWVVQNGVRVAGDIGTQEYPNSAPIWAHDILGTGQVVTVADSGLTDNDCYFSPAATHQSVAAPGTLTLNNGLRKMIAYNTLPGAADGDSGDAAIGYHGSHVSGSVMGDNSANLSSATVAGHNAGDGMAPNAKMVFQDIGGTNNLAGIPNDLRDMFTQAYNATARIHTNSWGAGVEGEYTANSQEVDEANYRLQEDMLILFAASNDGAGVNGNKTVGGENDTIGSPGTAKNTLTVGATTNGSAGANTLVYFSSRGNTDDGRIKPEIVAPGSNIVSHDGDGTACNTQTMSGTSMATPTVAGAAALARQYFVDGFYPSGSRNAADGFEPTAAALKAVLTAGARPITTEAYCTNYNVNLGCLSQTTRAMTASPNSMQGWGQVTLIDSLWFATAPNSNNHLKLWDVPNASGLTTGKVAEYTIQGVVAGTRLHINLVWSDAPGTLGAAKALVNDLNLEVIAPDGTTVYHGNQFGAGTSGSPKPSTAGAAGWDNTNNIESVQVAAPQAGNYRVRVHAFNVPGYNGYFEDRQGYALAATGNFTQTCSLAAPTNLVATATGANEVTLTWDAVSGATKYAVYRSTRGAASCGSHTTDEGTPNMTQVGQTTGTTFVDAGMIGGYDYRYFVKAITPCDSPSSNCASVTATGSCALKPTFGGLTSATAVAGASCRIDLAWSAGTSNCPTGSTVRYNIYRSTTPGFTPSAANRIASCVTGTSYSDFGALSANTNHYIVRAEDSTTGNSGACGGNEDANTVRRSATPAGSTTSVGTWTDGGGDTTAQLTLEGPWSIVSNTDKAGYARTGNFAYKTSVGTTNYPPNTCAAAVTPNLSVAAGASVVTFHERHDLEFQWDGVVVEYSTNNGSSWTVATLVYPGNFVADGSLTVYNACAYPPTQGCYQSSTATQTMTAYASQNFTVNFAAPGTLKVRWRMSTDAAVEEEGFLLDDISITNVNVPGACSNCTPPAVPSGVNTAATAVDEITVGWNAVAGATGYKVYRSNGSCPGTGQSLLTTIGSGSTVSYVDSTVTGGSTYSYTIASVGSCDSAQSSCSSATAVSCVTPQAPGTLSASLPANNTIKLDWSASPTTGVTYTVYRAATCGGSFSAVASGLSALTYTDSNIPGGTGYSYKVSAFSGTCESSFTNCVSEVASGGPGNFSRQTNNDGKPENTSDTSSLVRWMFNTTASALSPPAIDSSVFAVSNDRFAHAMTPGDQQGTWPAGWKPLAMNRVAQGRPSAVPTPNIAGSAKTIFLGSQDGFVYAINAATGARVWRSRLAGGIDSPLAEIIQASPNYLQRDFTGLALDLVTVGTRNSSGANKLIALDASTGIVAWEFTNASGQGGDGLNIGVINGSAAVDTLNKRVFFTSRANATGSNATVWAITFTASSATLNWKAALGDVDGSASYFNNRLYVGTNLGNIHALNATPGTGNGASVWSAPFNSGDGAIKGIVLLDRAVTPLRIYFSTTNTVWSLSDGGTAATENWRVTSVGFPSVPTLTGSRPIFTGKALIFGSSNGNLYQLTNIMTATPTIKSASLGSQVVGSPVFNGTTDLIYVGTDAGTVYAVKAQ